MTVLPESAVGSEAGVLKDAESAQDLLREIGAFKYRHGGIYIPAEPSVLSGHPGGIRIRGARKKKTRCNRRSAIGGCRLVV